MANDERKVLDYGVQPHWTKTPLNKWTAASFLIPEIAIVIMGEQHSGWDSPVFDHNFLLLLAFGFKFAMHIIWPMIGLVAGFIGVYQTILVGHYAQAAASAVGIALNIYWGVLIAVVIHQYYHVYYHWL